MRALAELRSARQSKIELSSRSSRIIKEAPKTRKYPVPPHVQEELDDLATEEKAEKARLPLYLRKLVTGFQYRVYYFEMLDCFRKLAIVCMPVFFSPAGTPAQLIFGLMVCFFTFGVYCTVSPYAAKADDRLAQLCQLQIFFALLASVALSFSDDKDAAGSSFEVLLCILLVLPGVLALYTNSPLLTFLTKKLVAKLQVLLPPSPLLLLSVSSPSPRIAPLLQGICGGPQKRRVTPEDEPATSSTQ
jgi:hypothetical protein